MPASAVGLTTALGVAKETTYGTPVAPSRWYEITEEGIERQRELVQSNGLRSQTRNLRRGSRRVETQRWAEGGVTLELPNKGLGLLLENLLGKTAVITQPDAVGFPTVYLHTYELGSPVGKSLTVQKQLRDADNVLVDKLTMHGGKIVDWTFSVATGEIGTLEASFDFEDIDKTTAAGAPTYPDPISNFHFGQASLYKAGASLAKVTEASVEGANNLKTDSFFLGTGGLKGEPFPNDFPEVSGSLTAEFDSLATYYDAFADDTAFELRLEFVGDNIAGTYDYFLKIILPECHFTGGTPVVSGPDVVTPEVPFEAAHDGTNPGVRILYQTTDSAA
ncbi:MAG: phage tail tube protein [Actinomycetota bacterium]|nr:phage tail tube protein [Actinomycetota bacterium]